MGTYTVHTEYEYAHETTSAELPTVICWFVLWMISCFHPFKCDIWLCMPSAFRMIAERTNDEFSIRVARWGRRLASLQSVSKTPVNRVLPPYPSSQQLVNQRVWLKKFENLFFRLSCKDLLHEESQYQIKMGNAVNSSYSHIKCIEARPTSFMSIFNFIGIGQLQPRPMMPCLPQHGTGKPHQSI